MAGAPFATTPRAAAGAPGWATALARDVSDWVLALRRGPQTLTAYAVGSLPDPASCRAALIYVHDETGGEVPAFSDGVNWRRMTDRAICS